VRAIAPRMPLYSVQTLDEQIANSIARPRFGAEMLTTFRLSARLAEAAYAMANGMENIVYGIAFIVNDIYH
jgi:hypothetical protein